MKKIIVDKTFYKTVEVIPETGFIYVIFNCINDKVYVGQTRRTPYIRWGNHVYSGRKVTEYNNRKNDPNYKPPKNINNLLNSPLYSAMAKYGVNNFFMQVEYINIPYDELDELEIDLIKDYESLSPSGYNLSAGGGNGEFSMTTINNYRKNHFRNKNGRPTDMLDKLPKYVSYVHSPDDKKWGGHHYIVTKHPRCYQRRFFFKKHGGRQGAETAVLNFLADLEVKDIIWEKPKNGGDELKQYKGLKLTPSGYKVEITDGDKYYCKRFGNKKYPIEERKRQAINYWNEVRNQIQAKGQILV